MIAEPLPMSPPTAAIPVLIVTFRNPMDALRCLAALARMPPVPAFAVFVCENGGAAAFEAQIDALTGRHGLCDHDAAPICERDDTLPMTAVPRLARVARLRLRREGGGPSIAVQVGQARENLGYAGGVNAYLEPLLARPGWPGAWVLNPDTEPTPDALLALTAYATENDRGMVGSCLVARDDPGTVQISGLAWRRWRGATAAVGRLSRVDSAPSPREIEGRLDAPSGASLYVTRDCLIRTGLMDERYFLYFEDLDWGLRAKQHGPIGYAARSIVAHEGGTTTGRAVSRRGQSSLTTYLDCRNRLLFVRRHFPRWLLWTLIIELLEIVDHARFAAFATMLAAARGMVAGLMGHTGRPDAILHDNVWRSGAAAARQRRLPASPAQPDRWTVKRQVKIGVSLGLWIILAAWRAAGRIVGHRPPLSMVVIYYHGVPLDGAAGFTRQMRQLARWARVVPADWRGGGHTDLPRPERRSNVAITFDDAFDSVLDRALPVLASHGFACTVFVPTGHVGRPPSWAMDPDVGRDENVACADRLSRVPTDLVTLGSHTTTHPHLPSLPRESVRHELAQSMQDLTEIAGRRPTLFAFPYGDRDADSEAACRACGYERVFTIEPRPVLPAHDAFARGRIAVDPTDGPLEFFLKATGCYRWMATFSVIKRALGR